MISKERVFSLFIYLCTRIYLISNGMYRFLDVPHMQQAATLFHMAA